MSHDVFICHSSEDRAIADAICSHLEQAHIRCWIAPRDVLPGSDYAESILHAISTSRVAVLVFSDHSNQSAHVHREIERCVGHGVIILPFRLTATPPSASLEYFISNAHWLDAMTPPLEQHIAHLVGTVRLLLERDTPGVAPPVGSALPPPTPVLASAPAPIVAQSGFGASVPPGGGPVYGTMPAPAPRRSRTGLWIGLAAFAAIVIGIGAVVAISTDGDETGTSVVPTSESTVPGSTDSSSTSPATTDVPVTSPADLLQGPVDVLDGFSFTLTMTFTWDGGTMDIASSGVFVAPGDQQCTMTGEMNGISFTSSAVIIGDAAWYDDGTGGGFVQTTPDDPDLTSLLSGCPTSHEMWGEDFETAPSGGTEVTTDGMTLIEYDVTELAGSWGSFFGLPEGLNAEQMIIRVAADRTWVAGMDTTLSGSAEVFRSAMGIPPAGIDGNCSVAFSLHIRQPNDPTLVVTPPM